MDEACRAFTKGEIKFFSCDTGSSKLLQPTIVDVRLMHRITILSSGDRIIY